MSNEDINSVISANLKRIRKERDLSLTNLSELSGVSKSMLAQIERQESNPSVSILWKIAMALKISFTALLEENDNEVRVLSTKDVKALSEDEGRFNLYPFFPFKSDTNFEMLYIVLEKDAISPSQPHDKGTYEYIIVFSGKLEVVVDNKSYILNEGEAIKYPADVKHEYRNASDEVTKISMIIYYE